jgi:uncharacterized membrane protein
MLLSGALGAYSLLRGKPKLAATAALGAIGAVAVRRSAAKAALEQAKPHAAVASFVIRCSPQKAYELWRDFENLPRFMRHLQSVVRGKENQSRWTVAGPMGVHLSWNAEIVDDVKNERISWRSLPGSLVANEGVIEFRPGPHEGSIVATLRMQYFLPGGALGKTFATMLGRNPEFTVREDLRHFKSFLEAGEIPTTMGQTHGPRGIHGHLQRVLLRETSNMVQPQKSGNVEPIRRIA